MEKGRIIKIISHQYQVLVDGELLECVAMGKLRKDKAPVVGDLVLVERFGDQNGIQQILPRQNELVRPRIANVDQAIIVMSACDPQFSTALVDRLIFLICYAKIKPIICVSKMDLVDANDPVHAALLDYRNSGYEVFETGLDRSDEALKQMLKGKISVLTGQSGAGKSSLINRLDANFELKTQQISKALGRGKHTTRHCELMAVSGGWVADTPGFLLLTLRTWKSTSWRLPFPIFKRCWGTVAFRTAGI